MLVYSCVEPFQEEEVLRKIFPGSQPSASCGLPVGTDSSVHKPSAFLSSPQHVTRGEEIFVIFRLDRIRALFISSYLSPVLGRKRWESRKLLTKQVTHFCTLGIFDEATLRKKSTQQQLLQRTFRSGGYQPHSIIFSPQFKIPVSA